MKRLFSPVDISSLAFFRMIFGILAFADVMGTWTYKHLYEKALASDQFHFTYYGFEWVHPLSEPWMSLFFIGMLLLAIGIAIGWHYKMCTLLFAIGFTYTFLLEKAFYLNHGYLFCVLSFLMVFLPANRAWSIDVLRKPAIRLKQIPYWPLFLLQFCMGAVYFFGGIAKINKDWLNGLPLKIWLKNKSDMPVLGYLWGQEWVAYFMSYSGLLLDLTVVFFLMSRKTRVWALGFVLFFHATNMILFQIGIFPFLSVFLTLLYFPADFPKRAFRWFSHRITRLQKLPLWWQRRLEQAMTKQENPDGPLSLVYSAGQMRLITALIACFCLLHVLVPLRHHYFKGPVAWTEEGHRYAWRMMLRSKRGYGHFKVLDHKTGKITRVNGKEHLSRRQKQKLYTHPDMILQFAHYLEDYYRKQGMDSLAVYADIKVKLNGRPHQRYINKEVDLTKEEWSFLQSSTWVLPLGEIGVKDQKNE